MIYTLHPGGRDVGFKPHVHLVMTKGGLKNDKWVEIDKLPGGRLAAKWRYLLCKHLRKSRPFDQKLRKAIDQGYRDYRGYQVKTDSFYPKGLDAAKYIGRYLGHPPWPPHTSPTTTVSSSPTGTSTPTPASASLSLALPSISSHE